MSVTRRAEVLARGRADAEALMLDAGRALRELGERYDPAEQATVTDYDELFESPCKLQADNRQSSTEEVGARTAALAQVVLHLPASTAPLEPGDVWEMTVVHPQSLAREGRRYRVIGPFEKTWATARRYEVQEVIT